MGKKYTKIGCLFHCSSVVREITGITKRQKTSNFRIQTGMCNRSVIFRKQFDSELLQYKTIHMKNIKYQQTNKK